MVPNPKAFVLFSPPTVTGPNFFFGILDRIFFFWRWKQKQKVPLRRMLVLGFALPHLKQKTVQLPRKLDWKTPALPACPWEGNTWSAIALLRLHNIRGMNLKKKFHEEPFRCAEDLNGFGKILYSQCYLYVLIFETILFRRKPVVIKPKFFCYRVTSSG